MRLRPLLLGLALALPPVLATADSCSDLGALLSDALPSNAPLSDTQAALPLLANVQSCGRSLGADGRAGLHCQWRFAYRADAARTKAEALTATVAQCADAGAPITDQPVNHPDSYDAQTYRVGPRAVSVSLKDKAALGASYVFLRID